MNSIAMMVQEGARRNQKLNISAADSADQALKAALENIIDDCVRGKVAPAICILDVERGCFSLGGAAPTRRFCAGAVHLAEAKLRNPYALQVMYVSNDCCPAEVVQRLRSAGFLHRDNERVYFCPTSVERARLWRKFAAQTRLIVSDSWHHLFDRPALANRLSNELDHRTSYIIAGIPGMHPDCLGVRLDCPIRLGY